MFIATITKKELEYRFLELAVMTQLEKQQYNKFYDYS